MGNTVMLKKTSSRILRLNCDFKNTRAKGSEKYKVFTKKDESESDASGQVPTG